MDRSEEPYMIFDSLDVDLVAKVLVHTAFSPFFVILIAIFYFFHGASLTDIRVVLPTAYWALLCGFWFIKWCSTLYRNKQSFFFAPPRFDWGEQIVVVTGGASGVGELLANTLAVRNVTVAVLDVKPIVTQNTNVAYYQCDISNREEVETVAKRIVEELGEPTVLVNNAGIVKGNPILDASPEAISRTFGVNTLAHFWTLKAFLPAMVKNKSGHIVTVASNLSMIGVPRLADYCASKAASASLHESLRYELDTIYSCPGVRTTLVQPGYIQTPMFANINTPQTKLYKFFFPPVQPISIVKRVIQALDSQQSQIIRLPLYVEFMPFLACVPSFIRDLAQIVSGANRAMENMGATPKKD